ncbi:MAG: hypothetical protein E3J70_04975 [Candidatus Heimdallarchaeota archaeon]|nr:MAG: hypothetical protein E3J70_04975 [Candidatus Heimdallarchaeota archaeon]
MKKTKQFLTIVTILVFLSTSYIQGFYFYENNFITEDSYQFNPIQNLKQLDQKIMSDHLTTNTWYNSESSTFNREFQYSNGFNESVDSITVDNCDDWALNNTFQFSDLRSQKIKNGNAESDDTLWTDYIPSHYNGNVTRESNPPNGDVIDGNYSWYFDVVSNDHTTIVGFDDPIDVYSDSVIFSFSYSLLRNNLGSSYDSNICIRLFFQFDLYIFIWFDGNPGVLSNVTGPGGYADLIINEATFDGTIHEYSLNITALGLELFSQKPDQLRSLAVETWGEIPYQMEFIMDDISLTDNVSPSNISLVINTQQVNGNFGSGTISLYNQPSSQLDYIIQYISTEQIYYDCSYSILGVGKCTSKRISEFNNWNEVLWIETSNKSYITPLSINNITLSFSISKDWIVDQILVDDIDTSYISNIENSTHQQIIFSCLLYNQVEFRFISDNLIDNMILSDYQITHNEVLNVVIESRIYQEEVEIYVIDVEENTIYSNSNISNINGDTSFSNVNFNSSLPRATYKVIVFWKMLDRAAIGELSFDITSIPTKITPNQNQIVVNYKQNFDIEIDYLDIEISDSIDFATVDYSWDYGIGSLQQNPLKKYDINVPNDEATPGTYFLTIQASRNNYATAFLIIEVTIVFTDFNLILYARETGYPGETITINAYVEDNTSIPISDVEIKFSINNNPYLETWTNSSGFASILYFISPIYQFNTLNITSYIIINEIEFLQTSKSINIELSDIPRQANLGNSIHFDSNNNETTYFVFNIDYPTVGTNWYINIPSEYDPISAIIMTQSANITADITPIDIIIWTRDVSNISAEFDILLIETRKPIPTYKVETIKSKIIIEISLNINNLLYEGLEITLERKNDWLNYVDWELYQNDIIITEESELEITDNYFKFKIYSSGNSSSIIYHLKGSRSNLIQMDSTTIILGIGTIALTIVSTILLFKKKSAVSLDVQL